MWGITENTTCNIVVIQNKCVSLNNVMHILKGLSYLFIEKWIQNVDVTLVWFSLK